MRGARLSLLCCWVSSAFLDVVSPWPSLARSDVLPFRETSRIMVANACSAQMGFLCFPLRRCVSIRRSLPRFDEVLPFLWISRPRWTPATSSLSWRSISAPGVLLVPAFRDLGLWEGMGGSSISLSSRFVCSARRQLQLSFSLGCGYLLHSFVCCPASQYLRDCGRVLEQRGALMAPAAAAPIAGCPCSRAAAAPPLVYLI